VSTDEPGYRLRGGRRPDVAAVTNLLANLGIHTESGAEPGEAVLFLASGGIGGGYSLSEFTPDGSKRITLRFRHRAEEPRGWLESTIDRLGLTAEISTTGGTKRAATKLTARLREGVPVLVLPDPHRIGYHGLPDTTAAAHFVVVYGESGGEIWLDDRNLAPLRVPRADFAASRSTERNLQISLREGEIQEMAKAIRAGLTACVKEMNGKNGIAAWDRWATALNDDRTTKGWPAVFADRHGLVGALFTVWSAITPETMSGGHLRDLLADGLAEAAPLLDAPELDHQAERWGGIARRWEELAAATELGVPEFGWMCGLAREITEGVRAGDEGRERVAGAAAELANLRHHYDEESPFTARELSSLFTDLGSRVREIHIAERAAIGELTDIICR
jgi:hypothetical protein